MTMPHDAPPATKENEAIAPLRSYADFKSRLAVGMTLRSEHHKHPDRAGVRRITKVQTNAIQYDDGRGPGWLHFPKANEVVVNDYSVTFLDHADGSPLFTYHMPVSEATATAALSRLHTKARRAHRGLQGN